jgi:hypothetical protein
MNLLTAGGVFLGAVIACGDDAPTPVNPDTLDGGGDAFDPLGNGNLKLTGVTVEPALASIEVLNDVVVTQGFSAVGHFSDGSSKALAADSWSASLPNVGAVDGKGLYTPSTLAGGAVTITANYKGEKGSATLNVKLHYTTNPSNVSASTQGKLKAANTADAVVQWAYPYDKTVFPRGLGSTPLEWNMGQPADQYYVHIVSPFYELETFTTVFHCPTPTGRSSSTRRVAPPICSSIDGTATRQRPSCTTHGRSRPHRCAAPFTTGQTISDA